MKLPRNIGFLLLLIVSIHMVSCDSNTIYNENIIVDEAGWYKNDMARFDLVIKDSMEAYNFYVNIRHSIDYRYSNLYLFMNTTYPNGNKNRDTIEFVLADKTGAWHGNGWGELKDNSILLVEGIRFPLNGAYTFQLQQAMRVDTLKGISDIGISIEKLNR